MSDIEAQIGLVHKISQRIFLFDNTTVVIRDLIPLFSMPCHTYTPECV